MTVRYPGLPPGEVRDKVALAVHRAVCAFHGSDGYARCADYAVAGSYVCRAVTGRAYYPQVGGVDVLAVAGPPREWFYICGGGDGLARGEYHAWVVAPGPEVPGRSGDRFAAEWVDFSARHYRALYERTLTVARVVSQDGTRAVLELGPPRRHPWTAPVPPDYLWCAGPAPPDWVSFDPDPASCARLFGMATGDRRAGFAALCAAALRNAADLLGVEPETLRKSVPCPPKA